MTATFAIARVTMRRFLSDRRNLFEMLLLPIVLIVLLGALYGGSDDVDLGVLDRDESELSTELVAELDAIDGLVVHEYASESALIDDVERAHLDAGFVVTGGYEARLESGATAELRAYATYDDALGAAETSVAAVITEQVTLAQAATFADQRGVADFDEALAMAEQVQTVLPPVEVNVTLAGEAASTDVMEGYDIAGQTMIVLFVFFTAMSGALALIESRRLGLTRRMLATPASTANIIVGEGMGRIGIAVTQGLVIMVGGAWLFDIVWGDPLLASLTLLAFCLVAAAASMLLGALVGNEEQANGLIGLLGFGLAVLGGAMIPLYSFKYISETVWRIAHLSPHAWAIESFEELVAFDGGLADVGVFLLILLGYAVVLFGLATWRLRTVLTR